MSSTTDWTNGENEIPSVSCRVAYMIDHEQPVLCTFISDQPLFFVEDVDLDIEDETFLEETGDLLFDLTQQQLRDTAQKLRSKQNDMENREAADRFEDFSLNLEGFGKSAELDLDVLCATLAKSRMGQTLLQFAENNKIAVQTSRDTATVEYSRMTRNILVHPNLDAATALIGLAESLRTAWQHHQGTMINPLRFQPDHAVVVNRVHAADLCTFKIRLSWELKMAGEPSAWAQILSSGLSDMAYHFDRQIKTDFRNLNNGMASQMAFEKWFLSDRCKLEDKRLIQTMLSDHAGFVFDNAEMSKHISMDVISRIGSMPLGENYLSKLSGNIISDPLYTEVRDRSSANFLWFIKFENAFRETERDLQEDVISGTKETSFGPNSRVTTSDKTTTASLESNNAKEGFGQVIAFPVASKPQASDELKRPASVRAHGNTVVSLFQYKNRG